MRPLFVVSCLLGLAAVAAAQPPGLIREEQGYRATPGRIETSDAAQWRAWDAAIGTRRIEDDGTVRPRFVRADIDAVANAREFMNVRAGDTTFGGVSAYGNLADSLTAPLVVDGDLDTWWEPDTEDLDQAWVEIDLGRTVVARRVRLRFADRGDPFLMFRVLVADGTETFGRGRARRFVRAGQVATPNKTRREFVFDLVPRRPVPDGVEGEPVQFVRVDLLGTDGPRAEEVPRADYFRLAPEDRGAVDHFRVTVVGRLLPVERDTWLRLPEVERGPVRYYRRERPRLAEVSVDALGDNVVALTQRALFDAGNFFEDLVRRFVTDGLMRTAFTVRVYDPFRDRDQVLVDLGGRFWVERIRLLSDRTPLTSYELRISDGSLDAEGQFLWTAFDERLNAERYLEVEETFAPRPVRLIELRRLNLLRDERLAGRLNELQAYGEGYVSDVTLTSPLLKFDRRAMVTGVFWDGEAPPGTRLEVRTRSGDELIQIPHYFNRSGGEVSQALWERLRPADQGPVRVEELPGPDWSPFSEIYDASGQAFLSPSPRRLALVQVRLLTFEPLRAATIRRLWLDLAPPLVDRAVAEITPTRRVEPGRARDFRIFLRVDTLHADSGFTRLRLRSSAAGDIQVGGVTLGDDNQLRFGQAEILWPGPLTVTPVAEGVEMDLPAGVNPAGRVLQVDFRAAVFQPSTTFTVELEDPASGRVQQVDMGDATSLVSSSTLVVVSRLEGLPLLGDIVVTPAVLTPNGDGIGDEARVRVSVFQLAGTAPLAVTVHDLRGRQVRDLGFTPAALSGEHEVAWDGTDDAGRLVPPGTYVVRVAVPTQADARGTVKLTTLPVAY